MTLPLVITKRFFEIIANEFAFFKHSSKVRKNNGKFDRSLHKI